MKIFKSGEIFQGRSHVDMVNQVLGTKYRDWRKCTVELDKFGAHGVISWFVMMDGSENGYGEGWKWKNYLSKDEEQITETNVDRGNIKLYHVQNEEGYHPYRLAFQLDPNQTGNRYKCKFIGAFCLEFFALPDLSTMRYKKVSNTFRLCEIGESIYGADDRKFFLTRSSKLSLPIEKLGFTRYSALFFVRKFLCKKLWGSLWGELWGKTGRKQAALQRPVFYTFFLCFELSKFVVYLLSLVVEVFFGVVGIARLVGARARSARVTLRR